MFFTIVKKELFDHFLSLRFAVGTVICLLLMVISMVILVGDYGDAQETYRNNTENYRETAEKTGDINRLGWYGIQVDRPPPTLQVSVTGVERDAERTANVRADGMAKPITQGTINPAIRLFPVADLAYIVAAVLSLLVFVFSYDALTGERESETIKVLFSYPVPRDLVILGKAVAGFIAASIPFVAAALIGALFVVVSSKISFSSDHWAAYGLIIAGSLVLIGTMFSLGLFVSACCRHSSTSITILVFLWAIFVMVVPNMSPFVAEAAAPITPQSVVDNKIRKETHQVHSEMWSTMREKGRKLFSNMRGDDEEGKKARMEFFKLMQEMREDVNLEVMQIETRHTEDFNREQEGQVGFTKGFSRVSPIACYVYSVSDLAATGIRKKEHFADHIERYRKTFKDYVDEKVEEERKKNDGNFSMWGRGNREDLDLSDLPEFDYQEETLSQRFTSSVWDMGFLASYGILFFVLAFATFLRSSII